MVPEGGVEGKAQPLFRLARKGPNHSDAREVLLQCRRHRCFGLIGNRKHLLYSAKKSTAKVKMRGMRRSDRAASSIAPKHQGQEREEQGDGSSDFQHVVRKEDANRLNVAGATLHEIPRVHRAKEPEVFELVMQGKAQTAISLQSPGPSSAPGGNGKALRSGHQHNGHGGQQEVGQQRVLGVPGRGPGAPAFPERGPRPGRRRWRRSPAGAQAVARRSRGAVRKRQGQRDDESRPLRPREIQRA